MLKISFVEIEMLKNLNHWDFDALKPQSLRLRCSKISIVETEMLKISIVEAEMFLHVVHVPKVAVWLLVRPDQPERLDLSPLRLKSAKPIPIMTKRMMIAWSIQDYFDIVLCHLLWGNKVMSGWNCTVKF